MAEDLFDLSEEYDAMLNKGIAFSGEDKRFFIAGRVLDLKNQLPIDFHPRRILDFGCGIGDTSQLLSDTFLNAEIVGVDISERSVSYAKDHFSAPNISFCTLQSLVDCGKFDLCYVNGVFHHIPPDHRPSAVTLIHNALSQNGYVAIFENNPWNIGARIVMSRILFDRDAQMLTPAQTRRLVREGGFNYVLFTRSLFHFPRPLAFLRFTESWLSPFCLGAQYYILATKSVTTKTLAHAQ